MPQEEYQGWQEYYGIEPWGISVLDSAQAHIASLLANVNRNTKNKPEPFLLEDFLIFVTEARQTAAEPAPINLADPDAQTEAMISAQFGKRRIIRADDPEFPRIDMI